VEWDAPRFSMALLNLMIGACFIKFFACLFCFFFSFSSPVLAAAEPRNHKTLGALGRKKGFPTNSKREEDGRRRPLGIMVFSLLSFNLDQGDFWLFKLGDWLCFCLLGIPTMFIFSVVLTFLYYSCFFLWPHRTCLFILC
jgi:hypothetical protein